MASSSYLKTQRRKKNKEKDTLVNRKQGVDNIIGNISTGFDGDIINVNNLITTSALSLSSGIRGKKALLKIFKKKRKNIPYQTVKYL